MCTLVRLTLPPGLLPLEQIVGLSFSSCWHCRQGTAAFVGSIAIIVSHGLIRQFPRNIKNISKSFGASSIVDSASVRYDMMHDFDRGHASLLQHLPQFLSES